MKQRWSGRFPVWLLVLLAAAALAAHFTWTLRTVQQSGEGADFLVQWAGARAFFAEGWSPYQEETTQYINRLAREFTIDVPGQPLRFASPLYETFLFGLFAIIPEFSVAQFAWLAFQELALAALIWLNIRLVRWKSGGLLLAVFFLFSLLFLPTLSALRSGNSVIIPAALVSGALLAIQSEKDELGGILLGLATFKPHVVLLVWAVVLLWAIGQRRFRLMAWMFGTLAALFAISFLLLPAWPVQFIQGLIAFAQAAVPGTPGAIFARWLPALGRYVGWALTVLIAGVLLLEWLGVQRREFRSLLWTVCLTIALSPWSGIHFPASLFVMLHLPLTLVIGIWAARWKRGGVWMALAALALLAVITTTITQVAADRPPQSTIGLALQFPLPAFLVFGLYWVRWWAVQAPNLWMDEVLERERLG